MSMALLQNTSMVGIGVSTPFIATGGVAPYTYSVAPSGAGGTIDPVTGLYTAPQNIGIDTVQAVDSAGSPVTATATVAVGTAMMLVCEIIRRQLGLSSDQVTLWDQKVAPLKDSRLYVTISTGSVRPFGNTRRQNSNGVGETQSANFHATLGIDILSRGPDARDRKEQVLMALASTYAEQQMEANAFYVAPLSTSFVDLSGIEGPAIPYRYQISVAIQYAVRLTSAVPYFDTFQTPTVATNP